MPRMKRAAWRFAESFGRAADRPSPAFADMLALLAAWCAVVLVALAFIQP